MLLDTPIVFFLFFIALFTGFVKAGLPVLGGLTSVMTAFVFPPKDAVGLTLLYLLAGDVMAMSMHWRSAHWPVLKRMLPTILIGIAIGSFVLTQISNTLLGLTIGAMIILLIAIEPFRERLTRWAEQRESSVRMASGTLAGFTTVVGNFAGPVLSLYFLLLKIDKHGFVGTAALFFLIVNVIKLPIYGAIGLFQSYYLWSFIISLPALVFGAFFGRRFLQWIPQKAFNTVVIIFTGLGGLALFIYYFLQWLA